jgi:hypothetical protein
MCILYSHHRTQMITNNPEGTRRKDEVIIVRVGRNNNNNKAKDDNNNDKSNNNVGEGKKEKRKVKFPCKLCKDDHLTHLCPKIEEASRLIVQHLVVLTNPFPHNQNMTSGTSNTRKCIEWGSKPLST